MAADAAGVDTAAAATPRRATGEAAAIGRAASGGRVSGCRRRGEERTRWPLEPEIAAGVIAGGARVIEIGVPRRRGAAKRMGGQVCDGWGGSVDSIPASGLAVAGVGIRICWAGPGLLLV